MALYDYKSEDGRVVTISRSMKSKIPASITRKGIKYYRVFSIPNAIMDLNTPKTVGALADKNTEAMLKRGDPRVKTLKQQEAARPWWRDTNKPMKDLNKLTPKQKLNYIKTGKASNG